MPVVVVNHDLPIDDALEGRYDDLSRLRDGLRGTVSALEDAEFLVCNPKRWDDRLLEALSPDDWIQATSAEYTAFPIDEFRERGISLTNASGIHDPVVAEHVFVLALAFSRIIPEFVSKQTERTWGPRTEVSTELTDWKDHTLTVYGLGNIGEEIAERGLVFGMDVYGVKRNPSDYSGCLSSDQVLASEAFHDLFPETDLLVVIVPLTDETWNAIDEAVFRALPDSAILVNVARGPIVDEAALVDVRRTNELAGAGLDVFETEPLPEDSPLWTRDDVIITRHVGSRTDTFPTRFAFIHRELRAMAEERNALEPDRLSAGGDAGVSSW